MILYAVIWSYGDLAPQEHAKGPYFRFKTAKRAAGKLRNAYGVGNARVVVFQRRGA